MKKRKDKKYQKSDQQICDFSHEVMRKEARKIDIKNAEIYRGAKISRATFSRHYRNVTDIKVSEENRVFEEFKSQLRNSDNRDAIIFKFVLVLFKNRDVFLVCMRRNDVFLLKRMIFAMNRSILRCWRSFGDRTDMCVRSCSTYLIIAVVEEWAKYKFRSNLLEDEILLIRGVYEFLERNQDELARIFIKWSGHYSSQKRKIVV